MRKVGAGLGAKYAVCKRVGKDHVDKAVKIFAATFSLSSEKAELERGHQ